MPKVLVLFHSRTGNTARLADAVVDGARSVKFTEVDVRRIDDVAPTGPTARVSGEADDPSQLRRYRLFEGLSHLDQYDGIVLGAPTRGGVMSEEMVGFLHAMGSLAKGALVDKVGSSFTAVADGDGGHEAMLWSMMGTMARVGMILCPPGDPRVDPANDSPYGATAVKGAPTEAELALARHQGRRVATVTGWVHHAKGHAAQHTHSHAHSHPHSH
jgi:NAD(P)H dehydrogenase (quinone)